MSLPKNWKYISDRSIKSSMSARKQHSRSLEIQEISKDFVNENKIQIQKMSAKKRGGPYSKQDRIKRKNEVYRLHFEFGYSAIQIADMMKINRNTINGDISSWYAKITKNWRLVNPEVLVTKNITRLELQRTRLREELEKTKVLKDKLSIEKLIFELDSKILQTNLKLMESVKKVNDLSTEKINDWLKKQNRTERYMTLYDMYSVSEKSFQRIQKIINEDREKPLREIETLSTQELIDSHRA